MHLPHPAWGVCCRSRPYLGHYIFISRQSSVQPSRSVGATSCSKLHQLCAIACLINFRVPRVSVQYPYAIKTATTMCLSATPDGRLDGHRRDAHTLPYLWLALLQPLAAGQRFEARPSTGFRKHISFHNWHWQHWHSRLINNLRCCCCCCCANTSCSCYPLEWTFEPYALYIYLSHSHSHCKSFCIRVQVCVSLSVCVCVCVFVSASDICACAASSPHLDMRYANLLRGCASASFFLPHRLNLTLGLRRL